MATATRLSTSMSNWAPVTRHYATDDGGWLAVTKNQPHCYNGTCVFTSTETGGAVTMTPLHEFPKGTEHSAALELLGYTVVDEIGEG